jgi:hypothetical protein
VVAATPSSDGPGTVSLGAGGAAQTLQLVTSVCWNNPPDANGIGSTMCGDRAAPPPGGYPPKGTVRVHAGQRMTLTTHAPAVGVLLRGYRGSTLSLTGSARDGAGRHWTFTVPPTLAPRTVVVAKVLFAQLKARREWLMYSPTTLVAR